VKAGWDTEDHWYASESASYSTTPSDQAWVGLKSVIRMADRNVLLAGVDYRFCDADFENWGLSDWQDIHSLTKLSLRAKRWFEATAGPACLSLHLLVCQGAFQNSGEAWRIELKKRDQDRPAIVSEPDEQPGELSRLLTCL